MPQKETVLAIGIAIFAISVTFCTITKKNPLMLLCPVTYMGLFTSSTEPANFDDIVIPSRKFTLNELAMYDGSDPTQIYVAVKGNVYRVSPQYYGKGQSYNCFAGTDCSRNLGKSIIGKDEANADWRNLNEKHMGVLNGWERRFRDKYSIVGTIVEDEDFKKKGREYDP